MKGQQAQATTGTGTERIKSITFTSHVKYHGHKTTEYIQEFHVDTGKREFKLTADYEKRAFLIEHIASGNLISIGFEMARQWNPYSAGEAERMDKKAA